MLLFHTQLKLKENAVESYRSFGCATREEICIHEVHVSYAAVAFRLCYRRSLLNMIFAVSLSSFFGASNTLVALRFRTLDGTVCSWPRANGSLCRSNTAR